MASTYTLQQSINWAQGFIFNKPLTIGTSNEPAITNANIIKQTILGSPFFWDWNRKNGTPFTIAQNSQDAVVNVPDFGYFEKAIVSAPNGSGSFEMEIRQVLGGSDSSLPQAGRPAFISSQADDNTGNITFRVLPAADQSYTITPIYQAKASLMGKLSDTWAPIPDDVGYVYNLGFLGMCMAYADDPRSGLFLQRFAFQLVGLAEGLSETERNIFLGNWLPTSMQAIGNQLRTQQGTQVRGA